MSVTDNNPHSSAIQVFVEITLFILYVILQCVIGFVKFCVPLSLRTKKNIEGDVALVTGAGSGIGRLTALRLARLKAKVVIWDINEQGVHETVKLIQANGGEAKGYKVDLCDKENVYKVAKQTIEEVGEVDILINNAGMVSGKHFLETPDYLIQRTFDVNVISHFWTCKSFLPAMMRKNRGHIVTIASLAGHSGTPKLIDYCASKHAAVGFDESLKIELESTGYTGIHTSCICPYFIQSTGMFDSVNARYVPRLDSNTVADEIIKAILYNRGLVILPGHFLIGLFFKRIVPWKVFSLFMRGLVIDAVPEQNSNKPAVPSKEPSIIPKASENMEIKHRLLTTDAQERQP